MLLIFVATLPFLLLFLLMVVFKRPALISLPIVLLVTILTTFFIWGMNPLWYGVTFIKAFFVTLDILLIIFGAVLLFLVLKKALVFQRIQQSIEDISPDRRVQAILIAWFFVSLIEGAAGFGTPAMLAAPILVHIGFRPLVAVIITLIGDSVAVTFGAVGVPITIGISQGLSIDQATSQALIPGIIQNSSLLHLFLGPIIPLIISVIVTFIYSKSLRKGLEIWKYAIFSGFCFTVPMYVISIILGPEFPSIVGALVGIFIVLFFTKHRIFLPKTLYRFPHDEAVEKKVASVKIATFFRVLLPYLLLVALLAITRFRELPLWEFLNSFAMPIQSILGTHVSHIFAPLYSPGFLFILVSIFSVLFYKVPIKSMSDIFRDTIGKIRIPFFSLLAALSLVNVLLYSEFNSNDLPSILFFLSNEMSYLGWLWPILSPLIGLIGAFVTGSATVSNLLFSTLQYETAISNNYSPQLILSLQLIGAAMGNMIAIHNIVVVLSIVGLHHKEGQVMRFTLIPALVYVLVAGVIGMIISHLLKG